MILYIIYTADLIEIAEGNQEESVEGQLFEQERQIHGERRCGHCPVRLFLGSRVPFLTGP